jgi:xanthine/CO dehydrogenase XdhC/CoxF family maturation factor
VKEIRNIISAYDAAVTAGKKTALATVVHVEGSSYRRPGARMLVAEDGTLTGAISGGCLEGDALRKALFAIYENKNKLVTYDTTDEDDARLGVQLGCNGIVHILFEPLNRDGENPIALLKAVANERSDTALVTLFSLKNKNEQPGTVCSIAGNNITMFDAGIPATLQQAVAGDTATALAIKQSAIKSYDGLNAFIQVVQPTLSLVIFGAGNDAMPLVSIANIAGFDTTVVDGRPTHATAKRFPMAERVMVSKAENALADIIIDKLTIAVLMTHNYQYDMKVMEQLLATECPYIGLLGPKSKFERMAADLSDKGVVIGQDGLERIHCPVGLDIGAETAEEIALSITAEIKAVMADKSAQSLKHKPGPIHHRETS